jgi:hypothetical protein
MFYIAPKIDGKLTRLRVELVHNTESTEDFQVTAKNKTLVLQTNRLLFISKGLKHRKGTWKLVSGNMHKSYALEKIIEAIQEKLEAIK